MRTIVRIVSVATVLVLGLLVGSMSHGDTSAQEATVPAEGTDMEGGVSFELLGLASGVELASPADLVAVRFSIEPAGVLPLEESDPTGGLLVVESGSFTVTVEDSWWVTRAEGRSDRLASAEATGDFSAVTEEITADEETTLEAGDVAWVPGGVNGEIRNDGEEPAEGLVFLVAPSMMEGTPTP